MDLVSQNLLMTSGGKKDPTYIDDVFSTYLWKGDGQSGRAINNGIKLSNNNAGNGVDFDRSNDYLSIGASSDFTMGTGDFTVECWVYIHDVSVIDGFWQISDQAGGMSTNYGNTLAVAWDNNEGWMIYGAGGWTAQTTPAASNNTWYHVAYVRSSGTSKLYINGTSVISQADTTNYNGTYVCIGGYYSAGYLMDGVISNFRVVKGTALYTANFTPPTKELTSVTNTKLLCCNDTLITGATVTPVPITIHGDPNSSFGPFTANDGEGGLVWIKSRSTGNVNVWFDTVRGANQRLRSDSNLAQSNADTLQPLFTNSGFTVGSGNEVNGSGNQYASWTWRKQKGFFDIVEFSGDGTSSQVIPHNLGSVPGCIMLKSKNTADDWKVYHRGLNGGVTPEKWLIKLNDTQAASEYTEWWNDTAPTATNFTVGEWNNASGWDFVAYVFAGGPSTAATARSVVCDATGDYLSLGSSSDLSMGTGDFTIEGWYKINAKQNFGFFMNGLSGLSSNYGTTVWNYTGSGYGLQFFASGSYQATGFTPSPGQWFHLALVRNSGTTSLYYNGELLKAAADTTNYTNTTFQIGGYDSSPYLMNGSVSNFRIVKGTAVYTSSFRVPTEPLTAITNTVLLCCNNSSTTGSTVTPGTITANGDPTASTDNPFDDPEGFKFGEEGDQNIIKCGSYIGNSTANHEMEIGWEPQWWLVKNVTGAQNWQLLDSMRGWVVGANDQYFAPNNVSAESAFNFGNPTSTGFNMSNASSNWQNADGNTYVYIAIRRPDGYVSKPVEVGTEVFAMDTGNASSTIPNFDSGFPVGFAFMKTPASSGDWYTGARLLGEKYVRTNSANVEADWGGGFDWDSNIGWLQSSAVSGWQSWMWKRHAGFDVVCYEGLGFGGQQVPHSLNKIPEMMWVKRRDGANRDWQVYHKGLNGGTNPGQYYLILNSNAAESITTNRWFNTAPTSNHITLGFSSDVNLSNTNYIAMLFASVEGVSKVGYYTGTGSTQTITTGFQPRFAIIKRVNATQHWYVFDTLRGWTSGNDQYIKLDLTDAQAPADLGGPTSTGFQVGSDPTVGANGDKYIYYAHA
jgi:hypothetical protein